MWNFIKGVKNTNLKRDRPEEKRQRDSFAVFYFMILWALLIIEGLNCEIIVLCSLVAISLAIISNFIIFIFEGKKNTLKTVFLGKTFFTPKNPQIAGFCIYIVDFQKFYGGACPQIPLANSYPEGCSPHLQD
jgi:hypothetical protein